MTFNFNICNRQTLKRRCELMLIEKQVLFSIQCFLMIQRVYFLYTLSSSWITLDNWFEKVQFSNYNNFDTAASLVIYTYLIWPKRLVK